MEESPTTSGYGSAASALRIIHAFDFPKFHYDPIKKNFHEYILLLFYIFAPILVICESCIYEWKSFL